MRLFIFESHPVQYHAPVYRELHRLCGERGGGSVRVYYGTDVSLRGHLDRGFGAKIAWDEPLLEGYPAGVLNNENGIPLRGFHSLTGRGIRSLLRRERPDAVLLTGLAYRFDWVIYTSALSLGIPIWLRTETQDQAFVRGRLKSVLRALLYRAAYAPVRKVFVIGKLNAAHYRKHGVRPERHLPSPYCVVDRFGHLTAEERRASRERIRREAGFDSRTTVLLFCGKLQPKKNPAALLEALGKLPVAVRERYSVLYLGSGELEPQLRVAASALRRVKTHFPGFKNQTEIAPYYLAADILVLPSRQAGETWGLVVNEALMAGCRAIVSHHVGCHADFQDLPGVRVFDGTSADLAEVLMHPPEAAHEARQREFMQAYTIRAAAAGIARAMGLPIADGGKNGQPAVRLEGAGIREISGEARDILTAAN